MIDVTKPFGFACLLWGIVLMMGVLIDKDSFVKENKMKWKVIILSTMFLTFAVFCILV